MTWALTFPISLFAVWALCFPLIRELKQRQVLDRPNERSSHSDPTPRGGGIAIVAVLFAVMLVNGIVQNDFGTLLLAGCILILAVISFIDDLKPLAPGTRFAVHAVTAILFVVGTAGRYGFSSVIPESIFMRVGIVLLLCLYLVGYTNSFNFMDGINGLAAMQAAFTGVGVGALSFWAGPVSFESLWVCSLLLAGSSIGFLPHNFPRGRVFMGDVGSVPLGFVSAALGVALAIKAGMWLLVPVAMLHANFILDTSITLTRRAIRGEEIFKPHRQHFYQRLVRAGYSHTSVTLIEGCLQGVTLALALLYVRSEWEARIVITAIVFLYWSSFFVFAERKFRIAQARLPVGTEREMTRNASITGV